MPEIQFSNESLDNLTRKKNSFVKDRSAHNESEDLKTKASSMLDKYRGESRVKQSSSVIDGLI